MIPTPTLVSDLVRVVSGFWFLGIFRTFLNFCERGREAGCEGPGEEAE